MTKKPGYTLPPGAFEKIMAVEGLYLDDEQKAMLAEFDRLKLSPEERRARIIARYGRGKPVRKSIAETGCSLECCMPGLGGRCTGCAEGQ